MSDDSMGGGEIVARPEFASQVVRADAEAPPVAPLTLVQRALRGRYRIAGVLGAVLGAAGAACGYCLLPVNYRSVGEIEVAPKLPRILYQTDDSVLPMFDSFVESQASVAASRRVVDMAMRSPEWMALGRGSSDKEIARFQKSLDVSHPQRTQFIEVGFSDADPGAAMIGANQVIAAYMKIVAERESEAERTTLRAVEAQRSVLMSKLKDAKRDILTVSDDLGEEALESSYKFALVDLNRLDNMLKEIDLEIATESAPSGATGTPDAHAPTIQEMALKDPGLAKLVDDQTQCERQLNLLVKRDGYGPKHPLVVTAEQDLEAAQRKVADRALAIRVSLGSTPDSRATLQEERIAKRLRIVALRDAAQAETKRLSQKRLGLQNLSQDHAMYSEQLEEVKKRLDQLNVESEVHGRISVVTYGERPVEPENDKRRSTAALAGAAGAALGIAIVLAWGIRDARLRHIVDVDSGCGRDRFLGILPDVRPDDKSPAGNEAREMVDYCVHHMRTMLQLRAAGKPAVVALTSPLPGDGKTTVATVLGMSFAATGARTLLIDCDLIGHGLTSAMRAYACDATSRALLGDTDAAEPAGGAGPKRGSVERLLAARQLTFTDKQVDELLAHARERFAAGNDSFVRLARALEGLARSGTGAAGTKPRAGVLEAIEGAGIEDCIVDVGVPCLSLLPVGDATAADVESLSPRRLERLLASCRDRYDTIVVDTGPVLGSLEAAVVASAADFVLLVVARGVRQPVVQEALQRLDHLGGDVAGVIFNRAAPEDAARSSYASRSSSASDAGGE